MKNATSLHKKIKAKLPRECMHQISSIMMMVNKDAALSKGQKKLLNSNFKTMTS